MRSGGKTKELSQAVIENKSFSKEKAISQVKVPTRFDGTANNSTKSGALLHQFEQHKVAKTSSFQSLSINRSTPAEIHYGYGELSKRQNEMLIKLPETGSEVTFKKSSFNVQDLATLTAKTGDEFAMFTLGSQRMIIRGDSRRTVIRPELLKKT